MKHSLDELVGRIDALPPLPDTTCRLARVLSDPTSSLEQIIQVIRFDQAVTAEVLKRCNSAFFGLTRRVTCVDDAIRMLGTVKMLQLVMAAHMQAMFNRPQEGYGLRPGALWRHSVAVALGCQNLARRMRVEEAGLLFTAGLLHDVGKIVLNEYVAEDYAEIAALVSEEKLSFPEAERRVLGYTHSEVGARVAHKWGLPEPIVRGVRYHHTPAELPGPDPLVEAVHLSDALCLLMGVGGGDDGTAYRPDAGVLTRHGLSERDLEAVGAEVVLELKSVECLFTESQGTQHASEHSHCG